MSNVDGCPPDALEGAGIPHGTMSIRALCDWIQAATEIRDTVITDICWWQEADTILKHQCLALRFHHAGLAYDLILERAGKAILRPFELAADKATFMAAKPEPDTAFHGTHRLLFALVTDRNILPKGTFCVDAFRDFLDYKWSGPYPRLCDLARYVEIIAGEEPRYSIATSNCYWFSRIVFHTLALRHYAFPFVATSITPRTFVIPRTAALQTYGTSEVKDLELSRHDPSSVSLVFRFLHYEEWRNGILMFRRLVVIFLVLISLGATSGVVYAVYHAIRHTSPMVAKTRPIKSTAGTMAVSILITLIFLPLICVMIGLVAVRWITALLTYLLIRRRTLQVLDLFDRGMKMESIRGDYVPPKLPFQRHRRAAAGPNDEVSETMIVSRRPRTLPKLWVHKSPITEGTSRAPGARLPRRVTRDTASPPRSPATGSNDRIAGMPAENDELTATLSTALHSLSHARKASLLLDTALGLIQNGRYGPEVESYLEVYLKTPGLERRDIVRALLARGTARKREGERLDELAEQDFKAAQKLEPGNSEVQRYFQRETKIAFASDPASHRTPLEIWERIASFIPRYHLRTWFFVSPFHREIAVRLIFDTLDLYFAEDQQDALNRGLDVFDRVKTDKVFAGRIKTLRIHWAYEEGEMLDLMMRIFRTTIPEFHALRSFEWIGYPELRAELVQTVLSAHPRLHGLGLIGWHFDAVGVSAFHNLHKFTLRAEDDDGFADMGEVRSVLDHNSETLKHLVLGAYLMRAHSWDAAFGSVTIRNLTHLDLVDTRISQLVLVRIAQAHGLQSLTLHGTFEDPVAAGVVFGTDVQTGEDHSLLPLLESFRFILIGHDDQPALYRSVTQFLASRQRLRRLDLGSCPWELVHTLLPTLPSLRVFGVRIAHLTVAAFSSLVDCLPSSLIALHLSTAVADRPVHDPALVHRLKQFTSLGFLHLQNSASRRPQPSLMSEKECAVQTDAWAGAAKGVAAALSSIDFLGWHGEHYVVIRSGERVTLKELPGRRHLDCGSGVDLGGEDAAWLERKDVPMDYEMPVGRDG
ncbi:hypothetical protein MIND_00189300 [Mycena indigotica]|uniref:Uncharacterized protein n=1 Tax=Mycena indigotica TaxID=2126181 RepID=A0A8H6T4W0_9AGAR|nr:uncharacterized protein MIND_00189300 [Mycena indigotica]KAF7311788.1 hypothetical protein MIND_00189300 [Mycena indigotica]